MLHLITIIYGMLECFTILCYCNLIETAGVSCIPDKLSPNQNKQNTTAYCPGPMSTKKNYRTINPL